MALNNSIFIVTEKKKPNQALAVLKMNIPHIYIGTNTEGSLYVAVEDTELFDYVDDYLTEECDIEYEYVIPSESNGMPVYTMFFPKETNSIVLETVLNNLSIVEIEKIYNQK